MSSRKSKTPRPQQRGFWEWLLGPFDPRQG